MSNTAAAQAPATAYTVWLNGQTRTGTAREVIEPIKHDARDDSAVKKMSVDEYVDSLIGDASLFFPGGIVPDYLMAQKYPDRYAQALEYLAAMPSSGVRILSRR